MFSLLSLVELTAVPRVDVKGGNLTDGTVLLLVHPWHEYGMIVWYYDA